MSKRWEDFIDCYGLITEGDGDGGDSAQRLGMAYIASRFYYRRMLEGPLPNVFAHPRMWFEGKYYKYLRVDYPGHLIRHPDTDKWYSNYKCMSRDNTYPLILSLSLNGDYEELDNFKALIKSRFYFLFNTCPHPMLNNNFVNRLFLRLGWKPADFAGISLIGILNKKFWPMKLATILGCISGLIKHEFRSEDTSDDLNLICSLGYLYLKGELTGITRFFAKYYFKTRAPFALDNYFGHPNGCPMNELWSPIIKLFQREL